MKQGTLPPRADLPPSRKAWNVRSIRVVSGIVALVLFAAWYWRYGGPWKLDVESAHKQSPVASQNTFDQQIVIPKISGGSSSMNPLPNTMGGYAVTDQASLPSGWTPLMNGNDPGQLLVDVTAIRLFREVERYALFQYIPKPHTMDENRNKPISYELIFDAFKCSEGMAQKIKLTAYYEDGTQQLYYPWGYAAPWKLVSPDTALSREMNFVCAVRLTSESPTRAKSDR